MATRDDARRIALALPETTEAPDRFAFMVDGKGSPGPGWSDIEARRTRVENPDVIAVRVAGEYEKETAHRDAARRLLDGAA